VGLERGKRKRVATPSFLLRDPVPSSLLLQRKPRVQELPKEEARQNACLQKCIHKN